jgi:Holliday junction resolvase RusA-like endonuclease
MIIGNLQLPISFTVLGEPASKANSRRLVKFGNRPAIIKSAKALSYIAAFKLQCPQLSSPIGDDVSVWIKIWYASRRPDLDDSVILDAMQGRVLVNDRQVKERHVYWGLDRDNPRATIVVTQTGAPCPFESS